MKDIVLYCKSYRKDFLRLKRLLISIQKFNRDKIPFYISTPRHDQSLLIEILGEEGFIWVSDEDIVLANPNFSLEKYSTLPGSISQQVVKSEFWRLRLSYNYLCLDSDSLFIRNFYESDFLNSNRVPYTVLHQNKDFFQIAINRGKDRVESDLRLESQRVKSLFNRSGPNFYCAPAPFIWSAKVWESLDTEFLKPKGISIWNLIASEHPESLIYGETLLKYGAIPLTAIEPLFRVYHYDWQYYLMRRIGETEEKLHQNYLGVIYQSNWDSSANFGSNNKSFFSRAIKRFKRIAKYLESFI